MLVRKTVTVLFCDLSGSTSLGETVDPERFRTLLARYFERMKAIVESHGGAVEKFIGDAVMAVFGVPVLHEDDALRAVRAAVEMRDALPELGIEGRIGVMTGEVVTGTEERLVTGDAVNVAARLEQAAELGTVLIGHPTLALVRDAAEVQPVEPLVLKGKAEPVPAYRLLRVREVPERRHEALFVGRRRELALVRGALERARAEQRCELLTVVGDAGVGKSRLVAEALASVDATVARGRCLPYGEGITYWPVVEVLKQLDVLPDDEAAAAAVRSLLRETDAGASAEDIAWAFRKTLEQAAAGRSLVVVFDDIQWGEETFRDLIEHVALLSSGAAILLLCMARPELTESHPAWPVTLRLEPLADDDVEELIAERVPDRLRGRIARAAGGNPLFVEEMVAMAGDSDGDGEVVVPPTLQALLAARLDRLEPAERSVLERGAIEGEVFHRGAVQALSPGDTHVTRRLAALVRRELIRPSAPYVAGDDAFRFRHLLVRDAAYDALPKTTRADLHARFGSWVDEHAIDLVELDEIVGYHLERACQYSAELGLPTDEALAGAARERLKVGGNRAKLRADNGAAASLYERAASLVPEGEIDLALETELVDALFWAGDGAGAVRRAESLRDRAAVADDRVGELCGRIQAAFLRTNLDPEGATEELAALAEQSLPVLEASGDDVALFIANQAIGWSAFGRGRADRAFQAYERAAAHARQGGLPRDLFGDRAAFAYLGATPARELLAWLEENDQRAPRDRGADATRAGVLAMLGRFDESRAILADVRAELAERGGGVRLASIIAIPAVELERLADNPTSAAELGAEGCRRLEELGEQAFLSTGAALLAESLYALDRLDEADEWAGRAAELGASDDVYTQVVSLRVRAKVRARRGELEEAERMARDAVAIVAPTDFLNGQGDASAALAEVLALAGNPDEATASLEDALARYERKGNLVSARRTQARLAELRGTALR